MVLGGYLLPVPKQLVSTASRRFFRSGMNMRSSLHSFVACSSSRGFSTTFGALADQTGKFAVSYAPMELASAGRAAGATKGKRMGIITMNNPPVNMFGLEELVELNSTIRMLEEDNSVRGMVVTSGVGNMFSAGINLATFLGDAASLEVFWYEVCRLFALVYGSRLLSVAAINGHSLALGSVIMLACHDRYALDGNYKLGLNEVQVGLTLPAWLIELLVNIVGMRNAEILGADGRVLSVSEAKEYGLVDKVFTSSNALLEGCISRLQERAKCPEFAQTDTMAAIRRDYLAEFNQNIDAQVQTFVRMVKTKEVQERIKLTIKALSAKKQR